MNNHLLDILPDDSLFKKWVGAWPVSEPPISYLLFSTMSMLGAAMGRQVFWKQDAHTLYPMLNLLLIGPSGIGKSTSILKIAKPLIDGIAEPLSPAFISGKATPEKLHDDLVADPKTIIFASELANFFSRSKYMEDMIPYVTQLLDYEPTAERRTKGGQLQIVVNPAVTIIGGSTVEWLQDQLPDSAASGGFLARFLIVKEDHKRQRVHDPESMLSRTGRLYLDMIRLQCITEFEEIVGSFHGPIKYADFDANDTFGYWYQTQQPATGALAPFSARAGEFVLRLAMLLALSCSRMVVRSSDIRVAISLYDYAIAKLHEVVVPLTPMGRLLHRVLLEVGTNSTSAVTIYRAMRNYTSSREVQRMLDSLVSSGDIGINADGGYFKLTYKETL